MKLLIVSGLSGAGKSIALQALEDLEYYCVDNLPLGLLPTFVQQMVGNDEQWLGQDIAVGIDARNVIPELLQFEEILDMLREAGVDFEVIFLEADDETLLQRFSETRRRHPLTNDTTPLSTAVHKERELLQAVSTNADLHLDTSRHNVHELRALIQERVARKSSSQLSIQFLSFGYKNGIPVDADYVFDVRCLPNPYWNPELRKLSGQSDQVQAFLEQEPDVLRMYEDIREFLEHWMGKFVADNRSYLSVAIGCTGGQHRSVYLAEKLADCFRQRHEHVQVRHRDVS